MPTTDERREVAARLRKCIIFAKECDQNNEGEMIRENGNVMFRDIAEAVGGDYANLIDSYEETLTKLADLIEPEPERTCRNVSDAPKGFFCSECNWADFDEPSHLLITSCFTGGGILNYCPNCGARVEEVE